MKGSFLYNFPKYFIGTFKLPFYIAVYTLGFMFHLIITSLPPSLIRRFLTRATTIPITRTLLFLLGKTSISKQLKPQTDFYMELEPEIKPKTSDVIITNTSIASIFMHQLDYSPVFAVVGPKGKLSILPFYSMIAQILTKKSIVSKKSYVYSIEDAHKICERAKCPLVLLPEGDLCNRGNQFVLPMFKRNDKIIFICGVCEQKKLVFDSLISLIRALGTVVGSMRVSFCLPQDIPPENLEHNEFVSEARKLLRFVSYGDHQHYS